MQSWLREVWACVVDCGTGVNIGEMPISVILRYLLRNFVEPVTSSFFYSKKMLYVCVEDIIGRKTEKFWSIFIFRKTLREYVVRMPRLKELLKMIFSLEIQRQENRLQRQSN